MEEILSRINIKYKSALIIFVSLTFEVLLLPMIQRRKLESHQANYYGPVNFHEAP